MKKESSDELSIRFVAVSLILSKVRAGMSTSRAVAETSKILRESEKKAPARATLYRWYARYRNGGWLSLASQSRASASHALEKDFTAFLTKEKQKDPAASIPEIIRRAKALGIVPESRKIDRTTVYRFARRENLPLMRVRSEKNTKRPFAYRHRMQMVLCDGKHFRAGPQRLKRVAYFFLDDATRYVLDVIVGTSETASLFLSGFYDVITRHGLMDSMYLDRGPGFIANSGQRVAERLNIAFIFGRVRYPEGHGKIERFNSTVFSQCLRGLDQPGIDPSFSSLRSRIRHYLEKHYLQTYHEGIHKAPMQKFLSDTRPLHFPENQDALTKAFTLKETRKVRNDNVISFNEVIYEVPFGYAGTRVELFHNTISGDLSLLHQGRTIKLSVADIHANARQRRPLTPTKKDLQNPTITTAAEISFRNERKPIVDVDGGYLDDQQPKGENRCLITLD